MIKILAPIVLVSLILLAVVGVNYKGYLNRPTEKPVVKPTNQPKIEEATAGTRTISHDKVAIELHVDGDIKAFAKRYNLPFEKFEEIEIHGIGHAYLIPLPKGYSESSAIDLFKKDPDVLYTQYSYFLKPLKIKFKDGVDIKAFAKRYNISPKSIGEKDNSGYYLVFVEESVTSKQDIVQEFQKDSDVVSAVVYRLPVPYKGN